MSHPSFGRQIQATEGFASALTTKVSLAEIGLLKVGIGNIGLSHDHTREIEAGSVGARQAALPKIVQLIACCVSLSDGAAVHAASGLVGLVDRRQLEFLGLAFAAEQRQCACVSNPPECCPDRPEELLTISKRWQRMSSNGDRQSCGSQESSKLVAIGLLGLQSRGNRPGLLNSEGAGGHEACSKAKSNRLHRRHRVRARPEG